MGWYLKWLGFCLNFYFSHKGRRKASLPGQLGGGGSLGIGQERELSIHFLGPSLKENSKARKSAKVRGAEAKVQVRLVQATGSQTSKQEGPAVGIYSSRGILTLPIPHIWVSGSSSITQCHQVLLFSEELLLYIPCIVFYVLWPLNSTKIRIITILFIVVSLSLNTIRCRESAQ